MICKNKLNEYKNTMMNKSKFGTDTAVLDFFDASLDNNVMASLNTSPLLGRGHIFMKFARIGKRRVKMKNFVDGCKCFLWRESRHFFTLWMSTHEKKISFFHHIS